MRSLILIFTLITLNINAQTILTATNTPTGNTEILTWSLFDSVSTIPKNIGNSQVWDFSNMINSGNTQQFVYSYPINTTCSSYLNSPPPTNYESNVNFGGYNATWNGMNYEWVGYTDLFHTVKFFNYATIYVWPVAFGYNQFDTFSGSTASPTTCSTNNEVWTGTLTTQAPGQGTVILPGNVSFSNCLQVIKSQTLTIASSTATNTIYQTEYKYYHSSQKYPLVNIRYFKYGTGTNYAVIQIDNNVVGLYENSLGSNEKITLFPDPSKELIYLNTNMSKEDIISYKIFSTSGVCLKNGDSKLNEAINISDLENGIYFIEVFNLQKKIWMKFVKD